jgi:hypothetical protein
MRGELLLLTKLDENVWVGLDKLVEVRIRANVHTAVILGIASRRCQGKRSDRCSHSNPRTHRDKQRRERLNAKQQGADNEPNQSCERESGGARRGVCVRVCPCHRVWAELVVDEGDHDKHIRVVTVTLVGGVMRGTPGGALSSISDV